MNGGDEVAGGVGFQQESTGADFEDLAHDLFRFVHGQNQDASLRRSFENLTSRIEAVQIGHAHIKEHEIGTKFASFLDGAAAVDSFGAYLPAGMVVDQGSNALSNDFMVVRNQDSKSTHSPPPSG